ncbi:MAG TPA: cyclodeaminase/cyclohydrolase family protein [Planctomycetota bacterium]|nr:cyclodeaminase/cyclohydrolase family protein [Planctomycetota bacterium]
MLIEKTLRDFANSVAAKTSTPGGGSVAAYASALGAALGTMAARYSEGETAAKIVGSLETFKDRFLILVDRDTEAYSKVSAAYGLPKKTDVEKAARRAAVQAALLEAADVPLEGMRTGVEALSALEPLASSCNRNLASDLASGALLLRAGIEGCGWNVQINAAGLADHARRAELETEDSRLRADGARLSEAVLAQAARLVSRP